MLLYNEITCNECYYYNVKEREFSLLLAQFNYSGWSG